MEPSQLSLVNRHNWENRICPVDDIPIPSHPICPDCEALMGGKHVTPIDDYCSTCKEHRRKGLPIISNYGWFEVEDGQ